MPEYPVMRLTPNAYHTLHNLASSNPDLWLDHNTDFAALLQEQGITEYAEETGAIGDEDFILLPATDEPRNRQHRADKQALGFYDSFVGITPALAPTAICGPG